MAVSCEQLRATQITLSIGGVPVIVFEKNDASFSSLRDAGWCATNVLFDQGMRRIGKALLEQYDLILDARKNRFFALTKSDMSKNIEPLKKLPRSGPTGVRTSLASNP